MSPFGGMVSPGWGCLRRQAAKGPQPNFQSAGPSARQPV